mgnify:FL=1
MDLDPLPKTLKFRCFVNRGSGPDSYFPDSYSHTFPTHTLILFPTHIRFPSRLVLVLG